MPDPRHVLEQSQITLDFKVAKGTPKGDKVAFKVRVDGAENSDLSSDTKLEANRASVSFEAPSVPEGQDSYTLDYELEIDGTSMEGPRQWVVWPRRCRVELVDGEGNPSADRQVRFETAPAATAGETKVLERKTSKNGVALVMLKAPTRVVTKVASPWIVTSWEAEQGAKRKGTVEKLPYTAVIELPARAAGPVAADAEPQPVRQYVNLPAEPDPAKASTTNAGHRRLVRIAGSDPTVVAKDDVIHVKVAFAAENSKRTQPKPGVFVGATEQALSDGVAEFQLKVPEAGQPVEFELELGVAGGDEVTLSAGVTEACEDDELTVQTWRKVSYEIDQPDAALSEFTLKDCEGLSAGTVAVMDKELGRSFIEFRRERRRVFDGTHLPAGATTHNVMDKGYFSDGASGKVLCVPWGDVTKVIDDRAELKAVPTAFSMVFADYLVLMRPWTQTFYVSKEGPFGPGGFPMKTATDNGHGFSRGDFTISRVTWSVGHRLKAGGDPAAGADWEPIGDGDPGADLRAGDTHTDEAAIRKLVDFKSWRRLDIRFADEDGYPGSAKNAAGELEADGRPLLCAITVQGVIGKAINGGALRGKIAMATNGGDAHDTGLACVLMHEMGHNMGQTYLAKVRIADAAMRGWGRHADWDMAGIDPPDAVHAGLYYAGHGHQGCHCAHGVSEADRQKDDYAGLGGDCIMFGESDMASATEFTFCEDCHTHLKAERLDDVKRNWKVAEP